MCMHPYIQHSEFNGVNNGQMDTKLDQILHLSTFPDPNGAIHQKILPDPYQWMQKNKDKVYELNARNSDKYDNIERDRLTKF